MDKIEAYLPAVGRLLLSSLFVWAGFGKLTNPGGAAQYIAAVGVPAPGLVAWVVIAIEFLGGLALLVGFKTRWTGLVLAIWTLITAFAIHLVAATSATVPAVASDNMIHFYKNLAIAGGMLYVVAFGAGAPSVDSSLSRR